MVKNLPPRTGQQYTIKHGDYEAVITELGATMRKVTYKGRNVIVPLGADDPVTCCHGQLLVPFPNRIEAGVYTFEGKTYELPIDEHGNNTAIHGYGYRAFWNLEVLTEDSVTLSWRVPYLLGYPFDVTVTVTYELGEHGMTVTVTASNDGDEPAPWALGLHPWLANGKRGATSEERDADSAACRLKIDANRHVVVDDGLIPTGTEPVEGVTDLREGPTLEGRSFDDAWLDVNRAADGTTTTVFTRPDGIEVKLIGDETINAWQCYTATGAPFAEHPYGVAVEPMTAPANAFRSGEHLTVIEPGESVTTVVRYEVSRA